MDVFTILALCYSLSNLESIELKDQLDCQGARINHATLLKKIAYKNKDIEAIKRVTYAESKNQGSLGVTGVIFVILSRYISGNYGASIQEVINTKNQFEPATKANGWANLPKPSSSHSNSVDTIISLIMSGSLLDPTYGSFYFQNPIIVSKREKKGEVSKGLTHFGNRRSTVKIKDHEFYAENTLKTTVNSLKEDAEWDVFGTKIKNKFIDFRKNIVL